MQLTERQAAILKGATVDAKALKASALQKYHAHNAKGVTNEEYRAFRNDWVRTNYAWFGQSPTASVKASVSRSLKQLEAKGLVIRDGVYFKLTPAGRKAAKDAID